MNERKEHKKMQCASQPHIIVSSIEIEQKCSP